MKSPFIFGVFFTLFLFSFTSCKKELDKPNNTSSIKNIIVPADFNWSSTSAYSLIVDIAGDGNGQTLRLYDKLGSLLDAQTILGNQVTFSCPLEKIQDTVRIYSPVNRLSKYIQTAVTHTDFSIGKEAREKSVLTDFALDLNGQSDYIEVNNGVSGAIIVQYPFTFSAWFRTPGGGGENSDMVLVNIADPNYATRFHGIYLRKYSENFYKAEVKSKNGSTEYVKSTNQNVSDDTWHQVVGVFTADGKRKLYLDGIYEGMSNSVMTYNTANIITTFGRWGDNTPNNYFHGFLDNICIWNRELSDAEVTSYYTNLPSGNETGLVGYWKFNEGSGSNTVNSAVTGNYNASVFGALWENISLEPDTDGDGVPDESDYWPSDPTKAYNTIYPSGNKYYFHMYEDLWPSLGDYDFNDVILKTKLYLYKNAQNNLVGGRVLSSVYWIGGGIPRGAGMEWFRANGSATQLTYLPTGTVTFTEPENVQTDPLVKNAVTLFNGNIIESLNDTVDFEYVWDHTIAGNNLWVQVYIYRDRDHEIHMYGHPPTVAANMALFGTSNDASQNTWIWTPGTTFSNPADFYKTSTNLPWGLEIMASELWIPNEQTEIILAYPQFRDWAESGGVVNQSWYNYPDENHSHLPGGK